MSYLSKFLTKGAKCSIAYIAIIILTLLGCSKESPSSTNSQPEEAKVTSSSGPVPAVTSNANSQPEEAKVTSSSGPVPAVASNANSQPYTIFVVLAPINNSSSEFEQHNVALNFLQLFDASQNFPQGYRYEFRGICQLDQEVEFLGSVDGSNSVPTDAIQWLRAPENRQCDASPKKLQSFMSQIRASVDDSRQKVIIFFQVPWNDIDEISSKALSSEISKIKNKQNICAAFFFGANGNTPNIVKAFQKLGSNIGPTKGKSTDQLEGLIQKAETSISQRCMDK